MKNDQPAYRYIEDILRQRIKAAILKPHEAVPSERELAKIYGVSLMTARHALSELEREGIVERRRGAGTFVAAPQIQFNRLMSYTEHMSSRGLLARSRVLGAEVMESEPQIAARLGLSAGEKIVRIERQRLTGEERCALETSYLAASKFSGLIEAPLERTSLFSICSAIMNWSSPMRTKKSTLRPLMTLSPERSVFLVDHQCCAFVK
jgi:GntR family transcriptional regulator